MLKGSGADLPSGYKGLSLGPPILGAPKISPQNFGSKDISSIFASN